jgi:fluoride exporter
VAVGRLQHQVARQLIERHPLRLAACLAVLVGGAAGTLARAGLTTLVGHESGTFPWSTLLVNVIGSFTIGAVLPRLPKPSVLRPLLVTGVLGGFTTMSTFAVDVSDLAVEGRSIAMVGYMSATLLAGLGATAISAQTFGREAVEELDAVEAGT